MKIKFGFAGQRLAVTLNVITVFMLWGYLDGLKQTMEPAEALTGAGVNATSSLMKCTLQSTPRLPAFLKDGDFLIGGVFSLHYKLNTVIYNYITKPEPWRCTGRLVRQSEMFKKIKIRIYFNFYYYLYLSNKLIC